MNTKFNQSTRVLLCIATFYLASCSDDSNEKDLAKDNPVTVEVGTPTLHSVETISVSGQIESQETAFISTKVMGLISSIRVKPGDNVQKGQLLVTISNDDILAKHGQAQSIITETEAALNDAQKDFERFEQLYEQQSASTKEFENASLRYRSLIAKAEAARQVKNEMDAMLAYTNLVAPFSGVITQKNNYEWSMANPGMPILTIEQADAHHVRAFISENEIGKLKNNMIAEVTLKATMKKVIGEICEISPSSQFSGGQFQIKIKMPANESDIFSGMHVNVDIPLEIDSAVQSLFVPKSAIIQKDQLFGLYTIGEDRTAQLRWLKVGKEQGNDVEILSGLKAGEMFITQSDGRLSNGISVLVKK